MIAWLMFIDILPIPHFFSIFFLIYEISNEIHSYFFANQKINISYSRLN